MIQFSITDDQFSGSGGTLPILENDEVARKLAMLIAGECGDGGPAKAAAEFGFSRQRYFQLRAAFVAEGAMGLVSKKRGPRTRYRRTEELVCQVIRHRFLDPDASTQVIAQKLRQCGFKIGKRSVDRVIAGYGLQKKTLPISPRPPVSDDTNRPHGQERPA